LTLPRSEHRNPVNAARLFPRTNPKLIDAVEDEPKHLNCVIDEVRSGVLFFYTERAHVFGEALRLKTKDVDLAKGNNKVVSGCRGERENHTRRRSPKAHSQGLSRCSAGIIQGIGILFCRQIEQTLNATTLSRHIHFAAHWQEFSRADD